MGRRPPWPFRARRRGPDLRLRTRRSDLAGRTPNQVAYLKNILGHDITFGIGPAGTGKTYLAVACAVDALERNAVQRIILTRPAVEAGERLGFLPGDLAQKVDPYLRPLYDALYELMGLDRVGKAFEKATLEVAPLAFMRGRTLNHAFVILDEAQNTTPEQMKMFLTRIGFGSKAVVTGDVSQIDLPKGTDSGLVRPSASCAGSTASPPPTSPPPTWCAIRWWHGSSRPTGVPTRRGTKSGAEPAPALARAGARPVAAVRRRRRTGRCCRAIASPAGCARRWPTPAELTVRIVGAEEGRALNREFRGKDYATNVLTFDYQRAPTVVADIVLCAPVVEREAGEQGIAPRGALRPPAGARRPACAGLRPRAAGGGEGDGSARERDRRRPRLRRSLRRLDRLSAARAPAAAPWRSPRSTRTIAAPSCQCSCSFSHQAPETTPSTGIIITDMLEAIGGRLRAMISQIAWAKPKIRSAL